MCVIGVDLGRSSYPFFPVWPGNREVPAPGDGPVLVPSYFGIVRKDAETFAQGGPTWQERIDARAGGPLHKGPEPSADSST